MPQWPPGHVHSRAVDEEPSGRIMVFACSKASFSAQHFGLTSQAITSTKLAENRLNVRQPRHPDRQVSLGRQSRRQFVVRSTRGFLLVGG